MCKTSPTQRSLKTLKDQGWTTQVVEHWNPYSRTRTDLWGIVDILAMNGQQIVGIQTTSGSNVSARIKKIREEPRAMTWIESGGRLFVHGWRKLLRSNTWECRQIEITPEVIQNNVQIEESDDV